MSDSYESSSNGGCFTSYKAYYHHHSTSTSSDDWNTSQSGGVDTSEKSSSGGCFTTAHNWYHNHVTSGSASIVKDSQGSISDSYTQLSSGGCFTDPIPHNHIGGSGNCDSYNACHTQTTKEKKTCGGRTEMRTGDKEGCTPSGKSNSHHVYCTKCGGFIACWCGQSSSEVDNFKPGTCELKVDKTVYKLTCNKTIDGYRRSCGVSNTTVQKTTYSLSCGKSAGQLMHERWLRTCGKTNGQLMHTKYIRSCGKTAGQLMSAMLKWN